MTEAQGTELIGKVAEAIDAIAVVQTQTVFLLQAIAITLGLIFGVLAWSAMRTAMKEKRFL